MNKVLQDDICFLCGHTARSASYDRGNGKAFVDCTNKACGEYLITNRAMKDLLSDAKMRQAFSSRATSRGEIQARKEILEISYKGGIEAKFKRLTDVLSQAERTFFGFEESER